MVEDENSEEVTLEMGVSCVVGETEVLVSYCRRVVDDERSMGVACSLLDTSFLVVDPWKVRIDKDFQLLHFRGFVCCLLHELLVDCFVMCPRHFYG